jgi:predicted helicase
MKIKSKELDFRGWETFIVKGSDKDIQEHFYSAYPNKSISILEHLNNRGTFEVTILPEDIIDEEEDDNFEYAERD